MMFSMDDAIVFLVFFLIGYMIGDLLFKWGGSI